RGICTAGEHLDDCVDLRVELVDGLECEPAEFARRDLLAPHEIGEAETVVGSVFGEVHVLPLESLSHRETGRQRLPSFAARPSHETNLLTRPWHGRPLNCGTLRSPETAAVPCRVRARLQCLSQDFRCLKESHNSDDREETQLWIAVHS